MHACKHLGMSLSACMHCTLCEQPESNHHTVTRAELALHMCLYGDYRLLITPCLLHLLPGQLLPAHDPLRQHDRTRLGTRLQATSSGPSMQSSPASKDPPASQSDPVQLPPKFPAIQSFIFSAFQGVFVIILNGHFCAKMYEKKQTIRKETNNSVHFGFDL